MKYDELNRVIEEDHDYSVRTVNPEDLSLLRTNSNLKEAVNKIAKPPTEETATVIMKKFAKCNSCRSSRTKVLVPESLLSITHGKNDGVTCDFCGDIMDQVQPRTLPNVFEGRRGSKGGGCCSGMIEDNTKGKRRRNYVYCGECGKVVLKESLMKHVRDVHEKSNKRECEICGKMLSGPFSLKEHISAVHEKVANHQCPQCDKSFAHFSNMNRHIRLVHDRMVVTHKYVNCPSCGKVVQSTSLKKHMTTIHEMRKDFICPHCYKDFAQSYNLKEHIAARHIMTYSHCCKFCNKPFSHKANCVRHLRTVHRDKILRISDERDFSKLYIISNNSSNEKRTVLDSELIVTTNREDVDDDLDKEEESYGV